MLVRIANREDPDQTASMKTVCSKSALFVYDFLACVQNFRTFIIKLNFLISEPKYMLWVLKLMDKKIFTILC